MEEQQFLTIYFVDNETGRKIMFKVNPLVLGDAENTTVIYPDGHEYRLVACEATLPVKIAEVIDANENWLFKELGDAYPTLGLPECETIPSGEEINAKAEEILKRYLCELAFPLDEEYPIKNDEFLKDQFDNNKEMLLEEVRQKFSSWITSNRTVPRFEEEQRKARLDENYAFDYTKRQIKVFDKIVTELNNPDTKMTFLEAIAELSTVWNSMNMDQRHPIGKSMIMKVIRFYEPLQVMGRNVIEKLIEAEKDDSSKGYKFYQVDEEVKDGEAKIDKAFWDIFKDAMTKCQMAAKENMEFFTHYRDTMNNDPDLLKTIITDLRELCNNYIKDYNNYCNDLRKDINTDNTATGDITNTMHGKLVAYAEDLTSEEVKYLIVDKDKQLKPEITDRFSGFISGVNLTLQHHQDPNNLYAVVNDLTNKFIDLLDKLENK